MERIGVHSYSARAFIEAAVASPWCMLKGIYSHLACADDPHSPMTAQQLERFLEACAHIERIGAPMPLRHLANSGGVLHFPETLAGHGPSRHPAVRRAARSGVAAHRRGQAGDVAGSRRWSTSRWSRPGIRSATARPGRRQRDTRVVTIPIGYGDGYPRALSSRGEVLIRGHRYPIVGRVCMDQFMVDIGQDSAWNEDEVVLIGAQGDDAITAKTWRSGRHDSVRDPGRPQRAHPARVPRRFGTR